MTFYLIMFGGMMLVGGLFTLWAVLGERQARRHRAHDVGTGTGSDAGLASVSVSLKVPGAPTGGYRAVFLVDGGAADSMASSSALVDAGIRPVGRTTCKSADGSMSEYPFGLAQIEFMGEITAGRVIFGPEGDQPILGVTALESVGITVDPVTRTLKRLPAVPLKSQVCHA